MAFHLEPCITDENNNADITEVIRSTKKQKKVNEVSSENHFLLPNIRKIK